MITQSEEFIPKFIGSLTSEMLPDLNSEKLKEKEKKNTPSSVKTVVAAKKEEYNEDDIPNIFIQSAANCNNLNLNGDYSFNNIQNGNHHQNGHNEQTKFPTNFSSFYDYSNADNFLNNKSQRNIFDNDLKPNAKQEDELDNLFGNESLSLLFNNNDHINQNSLYNRYNDSLFKQHMHQPTNDTGNIQQNYNNFLHVKTQQNQLSFLKSEYSNDKSEVSEGGDKQNGESCRNISRGLRKLSLKVKQIVQEKKQTSYKEVAETLVELMKQSNQSEGFNQDEMQKDEQNIKRRVYDALNVLIASNVIQKNGKVVSSIQNTNLSGKCLNHNKWEDLKHIQKTLEEKRQNVFSLQKYVKELTRQYLGLKKLQERNMDMEEQLKIKREFEKFQSQESINKFFKSQDGSRVNSQFFNQNASPFQSQNYGASQFPVYPQSKIKKEILENKEVEETHKFQFPVVVVTFDVNKQSDLIVKMNKDKKQLKMFSKSKLGLYGDLDILTQFGFDQVDQEFMQKHIPNKKIIQFHMSQQQKNQLS